MGLPCSLSWSNERFRLCLSADGIIVSVNPRIKEFTYPYTFWFKSVSNFGLLSLTTFINSSHMLAMSSWPCPSPPVAGRFSFSSRINLQFPAGTFTNSFTQGNYLSCMYWRSQLTEQLVCFIRQLHYKAFTSHGPIRRISPIPSSLNFSPWAPPDCFGWLLSCGYFIRGNTEKCMRLATLIKEKGWVIQWSLHR